MAIRTWNIFKMAVNGPNQPFNACFKVSGWAIYYRPA
jgi:hypothetical protein